MKTLALGAVALPLLPGGSLAFAESPSAPAPVTPAPSGPFTLPPLGYAFDALEPYLDARTMQIHHDKHHAGYVNNLNKAVAGRTEVDGWSAERLLRELNAVPPEIRGAVRNHAGGHLNHSLFWTSLRRGGPARPAGELAAAIDRAFGSFATFQERFDATAAGVFGSGWAWLAADATGGVQVVATANQDSPILQGLTPLLGLDVWEHAYYLLYQNRRADYVAAFRSLVDWDAVSARYRNAAEGRKDIR